MGFLRLCFVGLMLLSLVSLVVSCGGGAETKAVTTPATSMPPTPIATSPTLGERLEELEEAYNKGAITQQEYEAAQQKLIEQGAESR